MLHTAESMNESKRHLDVFLEKKEGRSLSGLVGKQESEIMMN